MKKGVIITLALVGVIAVIGIIGGISISNTEIRMKEKGDAQQEVMRLAYDEMYKVIAQEVQVTKEYATQFKDIFTGLIEGRYDNPKGGMMMWIQESNPDFSAEMYMKLMEDLKAERIKFTNAQKLWVDVDRAHKAYRKTFPNSIIVGSRPDLEGDIVTSTKTQKVFEEGKDDDVDLGF